MARSPLPRAIALHAFEAVARHGSFKRAAAELRVTPSAISHQIRGLEQSLKASLFRRTPRGVELSPAGEILFPYVQRAQAEVVRGLEAMKGSRDNRIVRISAAPYFATTILIDHIEAFERAYPGFKLHLDANSKSVDFDREPIDGGIRYGSGRWNDLHAERLFVSRTIAVGAPSLVARLGEPPDLEAIAAAPTIDYRPVSSAWNIWFSVYAPNHRRTGRRVRMESLAHGVQGAEAGHGLLLAPFPLIAPAMAAGRLVLAAPGALETTGDYYFVCRPADRDTPKMRYFHTWLWAVTEELRRTKLPPLPEARRRARALRALAEPIG